MSKPEPPRPLRCPCCFQLIEEDHIKTDQQHARFLALIEYLMGLWPEPEPGTAMSDAILTLGVILENYEKRRWSMAAAN